MYLTDTYKNKLSGYRQWERKSHADEYLLYPQNMGQWLSIDEVSLSRGELYTILTNKDGKGGKGSLIAIIAGTRVDQIVHVLGKLPYALCQNVREVTLDMASNMASAVRNVFRGAKLVTDRFHVVRLVMDAMHQVRIRLRWEQIELENTLKKQNRGWTAPELANGDTPRQLLARLKDVLGKRREEWTPTQHLRASVAFQLYPKLQTAYEHCLTLRRIYSHNSAEAAKPRLLKWIEDSRFLNIDDFVTAAGSIEHHMDTILNFFDNRSTNANAESFNAKIKLLRANQRGVIDTRFFLFRLEKLYA